MEDTAKREKKPKDRNLNVTKIDIRWTKKFQEYFTSNPIYRCHPAASSVLPCCNPSINDWPAPDQVCNCTNLPGTDSSPTNDASMVNRFLHYSSLCERSRRKHQLPLKTVLIVDRRLPIFDRNFLEILLGPYKGRCISRYFVVEFIIIISHVILDTRSVLNVCKCANEHWKLYDR